MVQEDAVTLWLDGIKAGQGTDIQRLWDRYFQRLVRLAGAKLPAHCRRSFDEEDVALRLPELLRSCRPGTIPQVERPGRPPALLATITVRKALDMIRHQTRQKRGGGNVLGESALLVGGDDADPGEGLGEVLGREPTPEEAVQFADDCRRFLDRLQDPALRSIAVRRLQGRRPRRSPRR